MLEHEFAIVGDVVHVLDELHAAGVVEQRFQHALAVDHGGAAGGARRPSRCLGTVK